MAEPRPTSGEDRRRNQKPFSRGGRGGGRGGHQGKKRDMGRASYGKQKGDKRKRNDDEQAAKKRKIENGDEGALPIYATKFDEETLKAEERRPKKKVAVMIGYAGTGYHGMQFTNDRKTIEGDIFQAFVAAGAISKANADNPKKSSFVRCARTDKGVHAAGNVVSLKLIVEDEDIVQKINDNLVPQIRVWGFERTNNSFSSYQMVDSRIYEYLIPSHSFIPPHPRSFMGRKCEEWAARTGDVEGWKERQTEVEDYWDKVDEEFITPILDEYDAPTRSILEKALYLHEQEAEESVKPVDSSERISESTTLPSNETAPVEQQHIVQHSIHNPNDSNESTTEQAVNGPLDLPPGPSTAHSTVQHTTSPDHTEQPPSANRRTTEINDAIKRLRAAYLTAKRSYRIPAERLSRISKCLSLYLGTKNYHNFTVDKTFRDPSAKRVIKSFVVSGDPILINGTEWLSLKVHGQSFMMHQIRKMVGMVALVVRSGCDPSRITDAMGSASLSIPKAPALGLLLERPVFDSYNRHAAREFGKEEINFDKYKAEMSAFKQTEIYERMYRDEEQENVFGSFFNHIDNFPERTFLYVTSGGADATKDTDGSAVDGGSSVRARQRDEKKGVDESAGEGGDESESENEVGDDKLGAEG